MTQFTDVSVVWHISVLKTLNLQRLSFGAIQHLADLQVGDCVCVCGTTSRVRFILTVTKCRRKEEPDQNYGSVPFRAFAVIIS